MTQQIDLPIPVETLASAKPIEEEFAEYQAEIVRLKTTAESLTVLDEHDTTGMKMARTARLALREIRIAIEARRKALKAEYLEKGRRIDGAAREMTALIEPLEQRMLEQEEFAKRKAAERIEQLRADRTAVLVFLGAPASMIPLNLGELIPEEWDILRKDAEALKEAREAKARAEEEARLEAERKAKEEEERRQRELEEARAKAEEERKAREAAEAKAKAEREAAEAARKQAEREAAEERARLEAINREIERKAAEERAAMEAKAKAEREAAERARLEAEAKAKAEREAAETARKEAEAKAAAERARLEAEARAAREAAAKAEAARKAAEEAARLEAEAKAKAEAEAKRRAELAPDAEKIRGYAELIDQSFPEIKDDDLRESVAGIIKNTLGLLARLTN